MKKYSKLFMTTLAVFSTPFLAASAKQMTLDELAGEVANRGADYVYIIGDYVYTNKFGIDTKDIMISSRSIPTAADAGNKYVYDIQNGKIDNDNVYKAMNIYRYALNDSGALVDTGNYVGNGTLPLNDGKINVSYIDYEYMETAVNSADEMDSINKFDPDHKYYEASFDAETGEAKIVFNDGAKAVSGTGIIAAFKETLNKTAYESIDLIYENEVVATLTKEMANKEAEGYDETAVSTEFGKLLAKMLNNTVNNETDVSNLFGKKFTIKFHTAEDYVDNGKGEYVVNLFTKVDTNKYFQEGDSANKWYNFSCRGNAGEKCTPVLNITDTGKEKTYDGVALITDTIKKALESGRVSSVTLNIGTASATYTKTSETGQIKTLIQSAIGGTGKKYSDLAALEKATITFNLNEGVISTYNVAETKEDYEIHIGQYVDLDAIVDKIIDQNNQSNLGDISDSNNYYNLSRDKANNSNLVFNVNLKSNGLYKFADVVNGLDKIIYHTGTGVITDQTEIQSIEINGQSYTMDDNDTSLATIIQALTNKAAKNVNASMLSNLELNVTFKTAANKELMPGTSGSVDETTATYHITFNINKFDPNTAVKKVSDNKTPKHFTFTLGKENDITVKLTNIKDELTTVDYSKVISSLSTYQNLVKSVSINGNKVLVEGNENLVEEVKALATEVLASQGATTVGDLVNLDPMTIEVVLADNVNLPQEGEERVDKYTYTLTFNSDASDVTITNANVNAINDLIKAGAERITLDSNVNIGSNIDIEDANDGLEIIGNGAAISGDINIKENADNVTIKDVNVTGEVKVEGNNATITGTTTTNEKGEITDSTTTISGAVTVKGENFTMDGVVVKGTDTKVDAAEGSSKIAVIDAGSATGVSISNSRIEYTGSKKLTDETVPSAESTYVYSLVYATGTVVLENNTINIANVKNPIEFKYGSSSSASAGTKITGNHFIGSNYIKDESHNVISIYNTSEEEETIEISGNTFEYASSVLRISNLTDKKVTYNVNNNTVTSNNGGNKEKTKSLIVVRLSSSAKNISNITINAAGNKLGEADWDTNKIVEILGDSSVTADGKLTLNGAEYPNN